MTVQRVTVTYSAPPTLQSTEFWEQIRVAINAQLPLRNLHWKSPSRPSIRTVQELQIDLVPYEAGREEHTSQVLGAVLEKPLLNLYIVTCEDAETYKAVVKKQIKDWHTPITQRKNQEWLIVHVVPPDTRAAPGTFLKMKGSVIDKIRADYNTDKRDRCVQLAWSADKDHPVAWVDFVTKMKEGILTAFDSVVSQREEDVKRSEGQRQMPGWNYCTYSILKESLAILFEGMSLFEDALAQYHELESTFSQVLREKNMSWFGKLISLGPKDDSLALLSLVKKPYRDLILANTISVFDFRVYLLARQCAILGMMGKLFDVCKKSSTFLATFSMRLRDVEGSLPKFFIESWIYSSALSVVEQCDAWAGPFDFDKPTLSNFQAAKGELLQLAANQLDVIGVSVGHLPFEIPFSASVPMSNPLPTNLSNGNSSSQASHSISKPEILSAISDENGFYDLYINVTKRAIDLYAKAGRRQFALKLHGTLAALDVHRGRLSKAHQTYSSLPGHYVPHGWASLGCYMHYKAIGIHSRLENPKDREWIHAVLDFLKAYVADLSHEFFMRDEDKTTYIFDLIESLRTAAADSGSDILYPDHTAITVRVRSTTTELARTQDGSFFNVTVQNHLPCQVSVDSIRIILTGPDSERMVFSEKETSLDPGSNVVKVVCTSSTSGPFLLDSSEIRLSKVLLQWNHKQKTRHSRLVKELPVIVHIPKDPHAVDVAMGQPQSIELGAPQNIHVTISTGRNHVSQMKLRFSSHAGIKFHCARVIIIGKGKYSVEPADDSLTVREVENDASVSFLLPHSDASGYNVIKVNVRVEYVTVTEPTINRSLRSSSIVPIQLPVAVNVEDFFRGKRLFTRFTISTTSHQHVRIRSAQLENVGESKEDLTIVSCAPHKPELVTATPMQPAHFLFRLESSCGRVRDPLRLRITYRVFRKEVEALIEYSVAQVLRKSPALLPQQKVLIETLVKALEKDANWVTLYGITGQLDSPLTAELEGELGVALCETKKILMVNDSRIFDDIDTWREVAFPVDVPQMNIVAAVRITIPSKATTSRTTPNKPRALYAGQPTPATLNIRTSFHWGVDEDAVRKEKTYMMRFDVEELLADWLVSGQKRGDFVAKDGETFSVPVTLVALHHGELHLPRASVTPLPVAGGKMTMASVVLPSCETYQEHGAEKVLVLPREGRSTFLVGMGGNI